MLNPSRLSGFSYEKARVEKRHEANWEGTKLLFVKSQDAFCQSDYTNEAELGEDVGRVQTALTSLRAWFKNNPDDKDAKKREGEITYLLDILAQDAPELAKDLAHSATGSQLQRLRARLPIIHDSATMRDTSASLPKTDRGTEVDRFIEKDREREITEIIHTLTDSAEPFFITASDSHRATGSIFHALSRLRALDPKRKRAILSFDHHSDTKPDDFRFGKESVMGSILSKNWIESLAIIGIQAPYDEPPRGMASRIRFCEGKEVYDGDRPLVSRFDSFCRILFRQWKENGIIDIYPSIDLDGLRVDELKYYGTDYSTPRIRRSMIYRLSDPAWLQSVSDFSSLGASQRETVIDALSEAAFYYKQSHEPYKGVPAAWIARALLVAKKEYGFHIGIRDQKRARTIVGDVTELHESDYKERTTKIAAALLNRLLTIAQE